MPPRRIHRRDRQEESAEKNDVRCYRRPSDGDRQHSPCPRQMAEPCGQQHRSARVQNRIPCRHVIPAAFSQNEKDEWHNKHPSEHPEPPSAVTREIEKQSTQRYRQREESERQLVRQKIFRAAYAHITGVDVLEK